ncbi:MAG: HAMP domain-containing protein [Gammaproteobacteria bacterium]|nr:HAMP domain-containing protein [Gammaproteobacteria bacterium]
MATKLNTLTARIILIGLAIHAVLLPLLFYGLLYIVEQSHEERFINDVRKYSRFLADVFEMHDVMEDEHSVELLDSAVLGSGGVFAELIDGNTRLQSGLLPGDSADFYKEDFAFGQHDDHIYFLSIALDFPARQVLLRMGFDEQPTIEQIKLARQRLVVVLVSYLIVSIIVLILLSTRMIRPLRILQQTSRQIAKGQYDEQLHVDSQLTEIRELSRDLESMRRELVGINVSLIQEIAEKEAADKRREELESELRQTQKLETVGVLAGGIAHEFNNILLPIFLYTEQAMHDLPPDSPIHERLERVLKSAKRAKGLIQQILTFSRQAGKQEYKPVDVKLIVEEALELLRALIPSTVELREVLVDDSCMVLADRDQIHQLVMNLCSNAYKALDDSGGSITVTLDHFTVDEQFPRDRRHLRVGKYIRLSVQDTGHGIDHRHLERIFEPFYTTRTIGKGTGLGLSVVHGIATSHKGAISVESEPGKGTTFYVYLPEIEQGREIALSHDEKLSAIQ